MSLTWLNNGFICKDLYAPFVLEKDSEYVTDLKNKYKTVIKQAKNANADAESLKILNKFKDKILNKSSAFAGMPGSELQLFRCQIGNPSNAYTAKDMLHLPAKLRAKSGNYRFSIPGNPSMYLANSSYGC